MAPPCVAELLVKLLSVTVNVPPLEMPPPCWAELSVKTLLFTVKVPPLLMMPLPPRLSVKAQLFTVNVQLSTPYQSLRIPPPWLVVSPAVIVIPETVTVILLPLYGLSAVKTQNGTAPESRWIVRFEAPGPLMVMLFA